MKKVIKIIIIVLILGIYIWFGFNFGPGSYPFVEKYKIPANEDSVMAAVDIFFERNEEYRLPPDSYLNESQCKVRGYWYHIYFYLPEEDRYISSWIRGDINDKGFTTFALSGVSLNTEPGEWSRVNKDLPRKENRRLKREFKTKILDPIKAYCAETDRADDT